ncbi:MAG: protein-glutamate O-methyltransferase CheR [Candidatus Riflebacteria bacterium]|nr:protein-glutamate O-methyltransferase CheR [Candidatus Riflebacteria bacterium]
MGFPKPTLSHKDFLKIRDFIYEKTGMFFDNQKLDFLEKRVFDRMKAVKAETPFDYLFHIKFGETAQYELQNFIETITTNETYMFREFEQLEVFANHCLPEIVNHKREQRNPELRLWSAGSSTGEEAYTLAIILRECLDDLKNWKISIYATDIDTNVLKHLQRGIYSERSVKEVPTEYFNRHLKKTFGGYMVVPETKSLVTPIHLNLTDYQGMRKIKNIDFVFCRNCLIYFDDASRKAVVDTFYECMNKNGYIFLGHSESVGRITDCFTSRNLGNFLVYYKR